MITAAMSRRAQELAAEGGAFVVATVIVCLNVFLVVQTIVGA